MRRPVSQAAILSLVYAALAGAWIVYGGHAAASLASSAEELERLEQYKGLAFVFVTASLLFLVSWQVMRHLVATTEEHARAREALLIAERKSLAGLFVSSLAHDGNNVAVVLSAALGELKPLAQDPDAREAVEDAEHALARLQQLFADLKGMGRARPSETRGPAELRGLVNNAVQLLHGHTAMKHARVTVVAPAPITAPVFPALVDQVLINLLLNAADATQGRGRVEVRLTTLGDEAHLEVHDDGPGVPVEQEPNLFKPFKTTKAHGTGLGLMSVRECALAHQGRVSYARSPLGGACFTVVLPLHPKT